MSVSDTRRMEMYETLIDRLGGEPAATLMEFLPPGGWENVATKDDLRLLKEDLRLVDERLTGKIDGLDSKIETGLAGVHSRIDGLDGKIEAGLTGLRGEFALAMARQTRTIVFTMVGIAITIWLALLLPIGAGG